MTLRHSIVCHALTVFLAVSGIHAAENQHVLVGICGIYSSGYAGVLARHGIPYEVVLDHQLADAALLMKYDAILTATMAPTSYSGAARPLETYVRSGGCFLFDAPYSAAYFRRTTRVGDSFLADFITYDRAVAPQAAMVMPKALALLGPEVSAQDRWGASRITCDVAVDEPGAVVLAEYASQPVVQKARAGAVVRGRTLNVGDPAVVMVPRGKGTFVVCGSSLGAAQALGAGQTDNVVLALVRLLTKGRAVPQLEPEGVVLGRRQSRRSLDLAAPGEVVPAAAQVSESPLPKGPPGTRAALPGGVEQLADEDDLEYNLTAALKETGEAALWLNYWNADNHVRLTFRPRKAEVSRVRSGRTTRLGELAYPAGPHPVTVQARASSLRLFVGQQRMAVPLESVWVGSVGWKGAGLSTLRYQPVAPVYFTDDFMRSEGEHGEWEIVAGDWQRAAVQNPDMGANPFAFHVTTASPGLAIAGYRFWDTYRFRASARPDSITGSLGLMAYRQDENNYLLFRCALVEQARPTDGGFAIVRVLDGKETVLESAVGGLMTGQSYQLEIKLLDKWIGVFVDGEKVLTAIDTSLPGGGVGLWADSAQAKFDDVVVEPADSRPSRGTVFDASLPTYAGVIDQDSWAGPAMQWQPSPERRGLFWNRGVFYGDVGARIDLRALNNVGASAELIINATPARPDTGYSLTAVRETGGVGVELRRNGQKVSSATVSVPRETVPVLAIRRAGDTLYGRLEGRPVVKYVDSKPLGDHHQIGFRFSGGAPRISDVAYWSDNVLDYAFDSAPTDWWIGSGTWDVTNRWSCTPDWSWFGGTSPKTATGNFAGKAVIWCKRRFAGDVALDYFTGPKMLEVPGSGVKERMQDFNGVICGDGKDVNSGYAFMIAPGGSDEVRLLKGGAVVARSTDFLMPRAGHNRWTYIRCQKEGNQIRLFFEGQLVLEFDDPTPLAGGYAGVWTENNGLLVPKVSLYHAERGGPLLSALTLGGSAG